MRKLSTGHDSTLGNYLKLARMVYGPESPAVKYLKKKIAESPAGEQEEVIADEMQMVDALTMMHVKGSN